MDYEFYFDIGEQRNLARITPPQTAFGTWLSYELGANSALAETALECLKSEQNWEIKGREWLLSCDDGSVMVQHHSLFDDSFEDEELKLDDEALQAESGPEDFEHLLLAWLEHLSR